MIESPNNESREMRAVRDTVERYTSFIFMLRNTSGEEAARQELARLLTQLAVEIAGLRAAANI